MKIMVVMLAGLVLLFPAAATVCAQDPVPPPEPSGAALDADQVKQLVGPIALYPDPLIAEILPASTFPSEVVMANRYVSQNGDPNQIAAQGWDPSVQALCHYANILKWMDDNLAWTTQLGQVFENQQADVMNSIQQLRAQAQSLGNLPSTAQESVVTDDGDIEIEPTDPDQMYVPSYPPDTIYDDPGVYCTFPYALPLGIWLGYDWNWHNHGLIRWGPGHPRPGNWWHQTPVQRHTYIAGHPAPVWHVGGGVAVGARGGWERGFATTQDRAPRVITVRPAPIIRGSAAPPVQRREEVRSEPVRSEPSAGFFVGGQSGHEAVESSSRGQASRASIGGGSAPAPHRAAVVAAAVAVVAVEAVAGEGDIVSILPMKSIDFFHRHRSVSALAVLACFMVFLPLARAEQEERFATADDAVKAFTAAAANKDTNALEVIFGPSLHELVSADLVQASNGLVNFSRRVSEKVAPIKKSDSDFLLKLGFDGWPFPIPLVKQDGQWLFDTDAGKEEILNRRIGRNELDTMSVCHAYVDAQRDYAGEDHTGAGVLEYAQHLRSTPGQHDGLYWHAEAGEATSPLGPLLAQARGEGYRHESKIMSETQAPYHGYYFKILTRQSRHAPGGKYDYIINGHMIAGFALVAWPAEWGNSGVMTFIINQQGKVYEKNLGPKTAAIAGAMTTYDPSPDWKPTAE